MMRHASLLKVTEAFSDVGNWGTINPNLRVLAVLASMECSEKKFKKRWMNFLARVVNIASAMAG